MPPEHPRFTRIAHPSRDRRLAVLALAAFAACSACSGVPAEGSTSPSGLSAAATPEPMAHFARVVGGDWRVTFASGESAYQTWQWGPGRFSIRKMPHVTDAGGSWAGDVMYWHPGRKQVRILSVHEEIPGVGRGVGHGEITFDGLTAEARLDLQQPRGLRRLGFRWLFEGPDRYDEPLLEDNGAGLQPLNRLTFVRIPARPKQPQAQEARRPTGRMAVFDPLVGHTWVSRNGDGSTTCTLFEWAPTLDVVCVRSMATRRGDDEHTPSLDAYFYAPIGPGALRCLALSQDGSVFEGDVTVLDSGGLQLDLDGYEGEKAIRRTVLLELDADGALHQRVCEVQGSERTELAHHRHERSAL